jgi:hypothetical protein
MMVTMIHHTDGVTLTIKPSKPRDRFPDNYRLKKDKTGNLSIWGTGLFSEGMNIGKIPEDYVLHKKTKYEMVFKTGNKRKIKPRKGRTAK